MASELATAIDKAPIPKEQIVKETVEVTKIHSNLNQEVIKITVDKLRLILKEYLYLMERKKEWEAPLFNVITLIVVLITTTPKQVYFSADTWEAIFIIALLLSIAWFIKSVRYTFNSNSLSVEELVEKMKKGE
jgi:hypothetical protein